MRKLVLLLALFYTGLAKAQVVKNLSVSLLNEDVALPFSRISPLHPGLEVGIHFLSNEKARSIRSLGAYAGGYYHKRLETAFYLRGEYQYTLKLGSSLGLDLPVGVGYLHTFYPAELYELDPNTGKVAEASNPGRSQIILNAGVGLRYLKPTRVQPFIKHEFMLEGPFSKLFAIMPHTFLKAGVVIPFTSSNKNDHE